MHFNLLEPNCQTENCQLVIIIFFNLSGHIALWQITSLAKMLVAKMLRVKVHRSGVCSPCRGSRESQRICHVDSFLKAKEKFAVRAFQIDFEGE